MKNWYFNNLIGILNNFIGCLFGDAAIIFHTQMINKLWPLFKAEYTSMPECIQIQYSLSSITREASRLSLFIYIHNEKKKINS